MSAIQNILYENENVLWEGRPEWKPYIRSAILGAIPIALFGLPFAGIILFMALKSPHSQMSWLLFLMPHFWIGLLLIVGPFVSAFFSWSRIAYAVTDKRVIIQSGIFARNINSIDFDKLSHPAVQVSMIDDWCGLNTGTVFLASTGVAMVDARIAQTGKCSFSHINDPYAVFKFLEKTEMDIKSDLNFPNALRPAANPGYKTAYQGAKPQPG